MQEISEFGSKGRFTATLQTRHEDDRRRSFEVNLLGFTAHQVRQFIVRDLDHQLTRPYGIDHVLTQRFLFDLVGKLLGGLVVHIGLQQRFPDILDGLRNIDFGDSTLTF